MGTSGIVQQIRALLRDTSPFDHLDDATRATLLADISLEYFEAGEVILSQQESQVQGLFLVESGLVRLKDTHEARLIDLCGERSYFGAFGLLKNGVAIYEAKAVMPTVCALLKAPRFLELYETDPDFADHFDRDLTTYVRRLGTQVDVVGRHLLFDQRLNTLSLHEAATCTPQATIREAATLLRQTAGIPVIALDGEAVRGLIRDADVRDALALGTDPAAPVHTLLQGDVATVAPQASLFDAMMAMLHDNADVLAVAPDPPGGPWRVLTDRDVAHFRGQDPLATVLRIGQARNVQELENVRFQTHQLLARLYRQAVPAERLGRFMAALYDRITVQVLTLVATELAQEGQPAPDVPWVWLRFGSGGRQEMALTSRQHNALLYADVEDDATQRAMAAWTARFTQRANAALETCGFLPSPILAHHPAWQGSLRQWKQRYRTWILTAEPADLRGILPCFDLRGLHGDLTLVDQLKADLIEALNVQALDRNRHVLHLLADIIDEQHTPANLLQRLVTDRLKKPGGAGLVDLRLEGILPIVDTARILALDVRYIDSVNTFDRLRHLETVLPEHAELLQQTLHAYQDVMDFRLEVQLQSAEAHEPPSSQLIPSQLTKYQLNLLRRALHHADAFQQVLRQRYKA